jgi:hypothetical protein
MILTVAYALWGVNEQEMGWEEENKKKGESPERIFPTDSRLCCKQRFEK